MADPTIRFIDPLQIAQERFERYRKAHALYVAGDNDDLQVAEVAALIAIAGLLRVLAGPPQLRPLTQTDPVRGPGLLMEAPCACVTRWEGPERTDDRSGCPLHGPKDRP